LHVHKKFWTQRQWRSSEVYPPAVARGDRVMQVWQRTEAMQRYGMAERDLAREDTKERVHGRGRIPQELQRGRANGKGATERFGMCGRARATLIAAGRGVFRRRVGSKGAFPGNRLGANMTAEATTTRRGGQ
jgi:hypothetical protein